MKAFVLRGPRKLQRVEVPDPQPDDFQVRVRVAYVGVCGSDVEAYLGHRRPEFLGDPPMLGHEPAGVIDRVGRCVAGLTVGDRVTCAGTWGCFADYILARPEQVLRLLPEIPLIEGSLIEALPGIVAAATRTGITGGSDVLVLGSGLSGLQIVRLVRLHGCKNLIAADLFDEKLALAREFGANHTINASRENVVERANQIVPGGVDVTVMATLDGDDVPRAVEWTRPGGKIVLYGSIGPCGGIDFFKVHIKGISIVKEGMNVAGLERRSLWRQAMQLVADGILNTRRLRTHVLPMERLAEAMELRATPRADVIHVLLENDWARIQRESD